ncbi:MAG: 4'-phosphopantetheinyl transferase family protein, partial [Armatimonadaceae bacterium]
MIVYTAFVQLSHLPDGFLELNSNILTEQERSYAAAITDWLQQSEWRCGRILLRYLVATAYDVPISAITIHSLSSGQLVAETPNGQVNVSHSRIPGVWAGATARTIPIGLDLVDVSAFPVDFGGETLDADTWATLEALAKVTQRGLDWALSATCYPVDGLVTAPNGETFQVTLLRDLPPAVRGVVLGPADSALN